MTEPLSNPHDFNGGANQFTKFAPPSASTRSPNQNILTLKPYVQVKPARTAKCCFILPAKLEQAEFSAVGQQPQNKNCQAFSKCRIQAQS